jgi:DNA-binding IclR family transcriptional regulator
MDSGVGVLDKAVELIELLAVRRLATPADLAAAAGLSRPTVYRLLAALEAHGLVERSGEGGYKLGLRHLEWAAAVTAGTNLLIEAAKPVLAALRDETGESAQLYVRQGTVRVCALVSERPSGLRDTVPVGAQLPLDRGSGGKVFLAFGSEPTSGELTRIRRQGWAATVADREPGVASVSAPVLDGQGQLLAVISVSGPVERFGRHPGSRFAGSVVRAAATLAERVGRT